MKNQIGHLRSRFIHYLSIATFFLTNLASSTAMAVPALPFPIDIKQPNGDVFKASIRGDEFQNWMENDKGYTIILNPKSGYYEYAIQDDAEQPAPSGIPVPADSSNTPAPSSIGRPKPIKPPRNTELESYQQKLLDEIRNTRKADGSFATSVTGTWAPTPVSGSKKMLVILVSFTNATISSGAASYWNEAIFDVTKLSTAKHFSDNSYGLLSVSPVTHTQPSMPAGVVSVSLAQPHPNCGKYCTYSTESAWINAALSAASTHVNFAALDTNSDGTIAQSEASIYFILAGGEASSAGPAPSIWAHAWGGTGVSVSGKLVRNWALNGEMYSASARMTSGVVSHEMGHALLGLPDLYDTSDTNAGLGTFSLMAGGSWNYASGENPGARPSNLDAWSRFYLGWATPQEPANNTTFTFNQPLSARNSSVLLINGPSSTSEYWLVENRPPVGWDAGMYPRLGDWTGGLLIQHIDSNIGSKSSNNFNTFSAGSHQGNMAVEPSTASCSLVNSTNRGCKSILYYSGNASQFTPSSTPSSNYYNGTVSNLGVTSISTPSASMTGVIVNGVTPSYALSVSKSGIGSVSANTGALKCGPVCSATYVSGTSVTLYASPVYGGRFVSWGGNCSGVSPTCTVTVNSAKNVTATFSGGSDFPPSSTIPSGWTQGSGSTAAWSVTSSTKSSGTYSIKAGNVGHSQKSTITYTGNFQSGVISFAYKVSSETGYDYLNFYIDGYKVGAWSGEIDWTYEYFSIAAGTHTIMWEYVKDSSVTNGSDTAWIDDVSLPLVSPPTANRSSITPIMMLLN